LAKGTVTKVTIWCPSSDTMARFRNDILMYDFANVCGPLLVWPWTYWYSSMDQWVGNTAVDNWEWWEEIICMLLDVTY